MLQELQSRNYHSLQLDGPRVVVFPEVEDAVG
jgi:hypothetical protein